jgi:hypothetical protein
MRRSLQLVAVAVALFLGVAQANAETTVKPIASWHLDGHGGFAFGFGSAWIAGGGVVLRVDPATNKTIAKIDVGLSAAWPQIARGSVWVRTGKGTSRIDPATNKVVGTIAAGTVYGFGSFWDVTSGGDLQRIDPTSGKVVATIAVQGHVNWAPQLAVGLGAVWVGSADRHAVVRVDPVADKVVAVISGVSHEDSLLEVGVGYGAVWAHANAAAGGRGILYRISASRNKIVHSLKTSASGSGKYGGTQLGFGGDSIWTGNANSTVSRVTSNGRRVIAALPSPVAGPEFIAYGFGSIWLCDDIGGVVRSDAKAFRG